MYASGYHSSLMRNLAVIIAMFLLIMAIWLCAGATYVCCRSRRLEAWWNNFMVRFLYEVFFELSLCLMINLALHWGHTEKDSISVVISLALAAVALLSLLCLGFLCFHKGPYI